MLNLIAETNGTRATYHPVSENGIVPIALDDEITIPVIAWDSGGFALVASAETGKLIRAVDADVINDEREHCQFIALDMTSAATGNMLP